MTLRNNILQAFGIKCAKQESKENGLCRQTGLASNPVYTTLLCNCYFAESQFLLIYTMGIV